MMTIGRDERIQDYLSTAKAKTLSSIELANELAAFGIDCISTKHLAAQLRFAGWSAYNNGKQRGWLAPGETQLSAGLAKPANVQYLIGGCVNGILSGLDQVKVLELHELVQAKIGDGATAALINKSMEARVRLGQWERIRIDGDAGWQKIEKSTNTKDAK